MGLASKIRSDTTMMGMQGGMNQMPQQQYQKPIQQPMQGGMQQPMQQQGNMYPSAPSQQLPPVPNQNQQYQQMVQPSAPLQVDSYTTQNQVPSYGVSQGVSRPPSQMQGGMQQPIQQGYPQQQQQQGYGMQQPMQQQGMQMQGGMQHGMQTQGLQMGGMQSGHADVNALTNKLQTIIQQNQLQRFYGQGVQQVMQKLQTVDFNAIAQKFRISKELAYDLAPLALYDTVFFCDDSGSMEFEEQGERVEDLKFILSRVADVITYFDSDGISVRFMNNNVAGDNICSSAQALQLLSQVRFGGTTPIGTMLDRKVIQPFVTRGQLQKPILCVIITDGEPSSENADTLRQTIIRAKHQLAQTYGEGAFAVQIAQVGKDQRAQKFLGTLDNDPIVGKMIDCTSYYEFEAEEYKRKGVDLTPELWLLKLCVGAIDRSYDEADE